MTAAQAGAAMQGNYDSHVEETLARLNAIYNDRIRPLEERFEFDLYRPSWFADTIKQKKPFVTFLGPYSAGKSTFINYLLQTNYLLTGPQPVTDKFTVIMHGDEIMQVPGRVLVADTGMPFRNLTQFGDALLECFQGLQAPHEILRSVTMIDTPGVLEAVGDEHVRRYDYIQACRWFVERSDATYFMFDPTKLDAGAELRMLFKHAVRGFETRARIIMNKADTVSPQELMRVYGALFWNLSNLINTTEPPRVYVSSFWDKPFRPGTNHKLFTEEKSDLLHELVEVIPMQSLDKRVTHVLKRAQEVLTHMLICATIRDKLPVFGKAEAVAGFVKNIGTLAADLSTKHKISVKDFGKSEEYKAFFSKVEAADMAGMDKVSRKKWVEELRQIIEVDLPQLLRPIKGTALADPRDRKFATGMQREFHGKIVDQLEGKRGAQGGLGESAAPAYRQNLTVDYTQVRPAPQKAPLVPALQAQPAPMAITAGPTAGAIDPQQMMQMMQMLQLMQQQQQQLRA
jgi:Mor family transcriptional regulator/GTPase SAR1 family protein